ncbi:glycerophosphodiester phosphodiesterase [Microbulbifer thermotolerans]|uniref:glycerophosphodiester phosphodiesterase n=1 Tax=Microbulbifer thermotolerans TaxID=252514 RepID=UPI00224AE324|nr:glycerophosphodiester phosphodiesterase [Microbulbifer thermotolerans]MCX2779450.1 glycerophosphodiester phosphodiesterase [Microbulbifer thermotolerans]MCX2806105.1 glycerophosphodiester phosphodiesterase [Microbulbifer thermotolerans]
MIRSTLIAVFSAVALTAPLLSLASGAFAWKSERPVVIAHRGASGYLPEHTLESKALAYAMRPDYIEQDLTLSKDDHLIVMHDIVLDNITNVAQVFPDRARDDGHYYTIDFTLAELKQLKVSEPFVTNGGVQTPKYPQRFPLWNSSFQLSTLDEEIELIQGLNKSLGYNIGIYPEIKKPWFHHREGKDIALLTLIKLKEYGYVDRRQNIYLQSFDAEELQRIKWELMPRLGMDLPLVQLIADTEWGEKKVETNGELVNYDYDWMLESAGLQKIAGYADGIGPWNMMLIRLEGGQPVSTGLAQRARQQNLVIHPYTFRADVQQLPGKFSRFDNLLQLFIRRQGVDGVFTDHPDKAIRVIDKIYPARPAPEAHYSSRVN